METDPHKFDEQLITWLQLPIVQRGIVWPVRNRHRAFDWIIDLLTWFNEERTEYSGKIISKSDCAVN
jgi:hypothetical protein